MPKSTPVFSNKLILWYLDHKRELPWRTTTEPYYIWLSEIILQQTRVVQGLPYYNAFISTFPTIEILANAPEDKVLKTWQGLGYYSRARNLHFTAKHISNNLKGEFPTKYTELLKLKGVGDYTASAIASICFNEPTAVVDGNVYRVLARVFGINTPINSTEGKNEFKTLAQKLIDFSQPGTYNQAIMEFGARHCKPKNPLCSECILINKCVAFQTNKVSELPVKLKRVSIKNYYFNYLVIISEDNKTVLQQRTDKGIWQQLYEFPLIETNNKIGIDQLKKLPRFKEISKNYSINSVVLYNEKDIIHKLSHRHLYTKFWIMDSSGIKMDGIPIQKISKYPVPILLENFMTSFFGSKVSGQKQKK